MFNLSFVKKKNKNKRKKIIFFNVPDELSSVFRQHKLSNSAAVYSRSQIEDLFEIFFEIFGYRGTVASK